MNTANVHAHEIGKFGGHAQRWWDPEGELKTLHQVNPLRLQFIQQHVQPRGLFAVDVGCGGGILSEALARLGATVLGIDLSPELIDIAELHGLESGTGAEYRVVSAERLAKEKPAGFDFVTCMEMLEHVPDPAAIVHACARLVKPGGTVFFSTLNRTPQAWLLAIVAAEHILKMIPKGTHDHHTFIRPSELTAWARAAGLEPLALAGIGYNPLSRGFHLSGDLGVNYLAAFARPAA